jgi:hypothetical protein
MCLLVPQQTLLETGPKVALLRWLLYRPYGPYGRVTVDDRQGRSKRKQRAPSRLMVKGSSRSGMATIGNGVCAMQCGQTPSSLLEHEARSARSVEVFTRLCCVITWADCDLIVPYGWDGWWDGLFRGALLSTCVAAVEVYEELCLWGGGVRVVVRQRRHAGAETIRCVCDRSLFACRLYSCIVHRTLTYDPTAGCGRGRPWGRAPAGHFRFLCCTAVYVCCALRLVGCNSRSAALDGSRLCKR